MNIQPTAARTDERSTAIDAFGAGNAATPVKGSAATAASAGVIKIKSTEDDKEPTSDEVKSAVEKLNQSMTASSQDLQFSVDEDSKKTVVKLIDRNTHEVLRQMPTKEALEIAKSLDKAMGKLIDQRA